MTENIRGIGINTSSVNNYNNPAKNAEAKPEEAQKQTEQAAPQRAQVKADDVLSFMAQQAIVAKPEVTAQRTYDVSKYVTPEQAARIAGFVTSFEDQVAKGLVAIEAELGPNSGLTEQAKYEIAAKMVK